MNVPFHCRIIAALTIVLAIAGSQRLGADSSEQRTPAETFVLNQVRSGAEADLDKSHLPNHLLRAEFLQKLITGEFKTPQTEHHGIKISHAVVKDKLVLASETISPEVWLKSSNFEGGVDFEYARFSRDLSLEGSIFGKPGAAPSATSSGSTGQDSQCDHAEAALGSSSSAGDAIFLGMKVEGTLNFNCAVFYVPLNLSYADVAGEFLFKNVNYESEENADFENFKVKEPALFTNDHFAGKIIFADAQLFELIIIHPRNEIDLDLTQAHIEQVFSIQNATLSSLRAPSLIVSGDATFENVVPAGRVYLVHSHFQDLTIGDFDEWLKAAARPLPAHSLDRCSVDLEGLSFEDVTIPDTQVKPQAKRLLELIKGSQCPFSPQPYMELEKFLSAHGYPQEADEVFIAMHESERKQLDPWKRPFDCVLDVIVGYGRKTWRAVIGAIALITLGTFLFRASYMEPEDKSTDLWYNPFWYSLDLFSPIDLGMAKKWRPKKLYPEVRGYGQVHRLLGWILIPLIVAAITGIIK